MRNGLLFNITYYIRLIHRRVVMRTHNDYIYYIHPVPPLVEVKVWRHVYR